jgi:hypothetical protein
VTTDSGTPFKGGERPYLKSVDYLPTEISRSLTVSGRVKVKIADEPDTDRGIDPYLDARTDPDYVWNYTLNPADMVSQSAIDSVHLGEWLYKKLIPISRASGATTNYQMKLMVGESSGSAGADIHCEGLCRTDFGDVRFRKADGVTELDYFIKSITGTTPNQIAEIWIEFDDVDATELDYYMFYDNPTVTTTSNARNTFRSYADFNDDGYSFDDQWTIVLNPHKISGQLHALHGGGLALYITTPNDNETAFVCKVDLTGVVAKHSGHIGFYEPVDSPIYKYNIYGGFPTSGVTNALLNGVTGFSMGVDGSSSHIYEGRRSGSQCEMLVDDISIGTLTGGSTASLHFGAGIDGEFASDEVFIDWMFERHYLNPEPVFGVFGAQEAA